MNTHETARLRVIAAQLEVNDRTAFNAKIRGNQLSQIAKVAVFQIECIFRYLTDVAAKEIIDDVGCQDWLQMGLFVWLELI